jgi:hypothetical protein
VNVESSPDNYALIAHPTEPRALVLAGGDGAWALPPLTSDEPPAIAAELRRALGIETTVLTRIWARRASSHPRQSGTVPAAEDVASRIYAVEPVHGDWHPPDNMRWVMSGELAGMRAANEELSEPVMTWLAEQEHGVPVQRAPWAIPGWRDEALAWVRAACERAGRPLAGSPLQVKVSAWATVWRIPTAGNSLYFKAAHPGQRYEAALAHLLAKRFTPRVPHVLAIDGDRGWLLIEDGGHNLRDRAVAEHSPDLAVAYLPELARLQRAAAPFAGDLLAAGCPDFRLARLPEHFAALVADPDTLLVGAEDGLPGDEYEQLTAMATGEVAALCARLAAYGIPETLHHDDLGPGNVLQGSSGFVFFDWAESAVTHPFCSLMILLRWARLVQECDDAALDVLCAAYLALWADYGPPEALHVALGLAHRLAYLCRALTYANLVHALEPRERREFADAPAYWLRLFLRDAPPGGDV